jgi:DNA gyrase subunit A
MSILPVEKDKKGKDQFLMLLTQNGTAKKMSYDQFKDVRRSGLIAIKLDPKDSLQGALLTEKEDSVMLATKKGQAIRFKESDIRENRTHEIDTIIEMGSKDGMIDLDRYLAGLVRDGILARDTAYTFARRRSLFDRLL